MGTVSLGLSDKGLNTYFFSRAEDHDYVPVLICDNLLWSQIVPGLDRYLLSMTEVASRAL